MAVSVGVTLRGIFRVLSKTDKFSLELETSTVREAINRISAALPLESRHVLIDPELHDPRVNALILVNGKEISALRGLETELCNGDDIVIIPITHGG